MGQRVVSAPTATPASIPRKVTLFFAGHYERLQDTDWQHVNIRCGSDAVSLRLIASYREVRPYND